MGQGHNGTGAQWDWDTIGPGDTMGLVRNGTRTQRDWATIGLVYNGTGTQ